MTSIYGKNIAVSIFGESHGQAVGVTVDGLPAGIRIDMDELQSFMDRRAPGRSELSTARREADVPEFISGIKDGFTTGSPVTALIKNNDAKAEDYDELKDTPRPGHADYTARVKYGDHADLSGGGHFSGRLTAPICVAGGIFKQILSRKSISIDAEIFEIGGIGSKTEDMIEYARKQDDSVGGIIQCTVNGLPAGIGGPMFGGLESRISSAVFGIPAVKGIEFGAGFDITRIKGSEANDAFYYDEDGSVKTYTNNCGGILGGISDGMPLVFRAAIKPTPSIAAPQQSISYSKNENVTVKVQGRHDPCIVPRALPAVEAAAAMAIIDAMAEDGAAEALK